MASISVLTFETPAPARCFSIRCWGEFAITDADTGADCRPRGRKARALIAYLAMHPGKAVGRERLMGLLWGERGDDQARLSLRQTIFALKHLAGGSRPLLTIGRESLTLDPAIATTDIGDLRERVVAGDYESVCQALPDSDDVLFDNLDGLDPGFDDWLSVERTRQRDALVMLIGDACRAALADGRHRTAKLLQARLNEFDADAATPALPPVVMQPVPQPAPMTGTTPDRRTVLLAGGAGAAALIGGALWLGSHAWTGGGSARDARDLYDTAHQIIYRRSGTEFPAAIRLLRRALALEPDNVPIMADLAAVLVMSGPTLGNFPEATRLARRAVSLDPRSALANGILGMVLGFNSTEARGAIKRAATLDPRDPQIQFWLSNVLGIEGDYLGRLQALRRAVALDPTWPRATGAAALAAWEQGFREESDKYAASLREIDPDSAFECDYAVDWARGDYSGVVRATLAARDRLGAANGADWKLGRALLVMGDLRAARLLLRLPPPLWRIASDAGPAPGELEPLLIEANTSDRADLLLPTAIRQLLRDGRAREIISAYDRRVGVLSDIAAGTASNSARITYGSEIAIALHRVGRDEEGRALAARAETAFRQGLAHGAPPNWLYSAGASIFAEQGRAALALDALQLAIDRGWHFNPVTPALDIGKLPAFATLAGDPRFETLRRRQRDQLDQERRKLGPVPV